MGIEIAPGFYAPDNIGPDQLAAYLKRLRFGGSSLTAPGADIEPGADLTPDRDTTPPDELRAMNAAQVPDVEMQKFMQYMQGPKAPINGTATQHAAQKMFGGPEMPIGTYDEGIQPSTPEEYTNLYPPRTYDLPRDTANLQQFMAVNKQMSDVANQQALAAAKQEEAESKSTAADAKMREAMNLIDVAKNHPEVLARTGEAAMSMSQPNPNAAPLTQEMVNQPGFRGAMQGYDTKTAGPKWNSMPPGSPGAVAAQGAPPTGKQVQPGVTPENEVRPGDWVIRGGRRLIWDGRKWS